MSGSGVGLSPKSRLRPPPIRRDHRGLIVADLAQLPFLNRRHDGTIAMNVSQARRMSFDVSRQADGFVRWGI